MDCNSILNGLLYHDQVGFIHTLQGWFNIWKSNNVIHHINRMDKKKHDHQSMQETHLTKFNTISWCKKSSLTKLRIKGNGLNIIKPIYEKHTVKLILNYKRLKDFTLDEEQNKTICSSYFNST